MSAPAISRRSGWRDVLRDRRMWGLGFLVLVVVPCFLLLSRWQLHRLDERRASNELITGHQAEPVAGVDSVMVAGGAPSSVGDPLVWRQISATGRYDSAATQLVRQRTQDGSNGYWVVTPLITARGVLAVNRGWLAAGANATTSPPVPPPPSGTVTVTGRLRASEDAPPRPSDIPVGQVTDLDVRYLAVPGAAYPGYLELVTSTPPEVGTPALATIPLPELDDGPHLSYALQWIVFAFIAVGGFVVLLRSEATRRAEDAEAAEEAAQGAATHLPV